MRLKTALTLLKDFGFVAVMTAISSIILNSRIPYSAGTGDHLVLIPPALQANNPSLYLNDYFVANAQQPHWFFELIVAWADGNNLLAATLFIYWIATIGTAVTGIFLLSRDFENDYCYFVSSISILVLSAGIRTPSGTSTIFLEQALPHAMGGAISLIATWAILNRFENLAFASIVAASLFHIQFGVLLAVLQLLAIIHATYIEKRIEVSSYLKTFLNFALLGYLISLRPIVGNFHEFTQVCNSLIPYHCSAQTWSVSRLLTVLAISVGSWMYAYDRKSHGNVSLYTIGLTAFGLLLSTIINLFQIPVLTELVQGNNVYRVGALLLPFAIIWAIAQPIKFKNFETCSIKMRMLRLAASFFVLIQFLTSADDYASYSNDLVIGFVIVLMIILVPILRNDKLGKPEVNRALVPIVFIVSLILIFPINSKFQTSVFPDPDLQNAGKQISSMTEPGSVVAVNPALIWIRYASGRAVVIDCKYKPIETGDPLLQFFRIFDDIGGFAEICKNNNWTKLEENNLGLLYEWAESNSANYVAFKRTDRVLAQISQLNLGTIGTFNVGNSEYVLVGTANN